MHLPVTARAHPQRAMRPEPTPCAWPAQGHRPPPLQRPAHRRLPLPQQLQQWLRRQDPVGGGGLSRVQWSEKGGSQAQAGSAEGQGVMFSLAMAMVSHMWNPTHLQAKELHRGLIKHSGRVGGRASAQQHCTLLLQGAVR